MVVNTINEVEAEDSKTYYEDQAAKVYPKAEEKLLDFLNRCRLKDS